LNYGPVFQLVAGFQGKRRGSVGRDMSDERLAGENAEITTVAGFDERICGSMDERNRGALRRYCHSCALIQRRQKCRKLIIV
jgi:hypothetical protein